MRYVKCYFQYYLHGSVNQHRVDIVLISYKYLQRIPISCLCCRHPNIDHHRIDIVFTSCASFLVYIVDIDRHWVDIVYTSYFFSCFIDAIFDVIVLTNIKSTMCLHCVSSFLFTSSTMSTSQWWSTKSQYRV